MGEIVRSSSRGALSARERMNFEVTGKSLRTLAVESIEFWHSLIVLQKIKYYSPFSVMNGLERGPDMKKKDMTTLYICVFPSLLSYKYSETPISTLKWDIGLLLVSLSSPGMSPWKGFIVYMKEDTSHQYLFPCRSWLPLYYRRKLNWADYMLFKKKNTLCILYTFCIREAFDF